MLELEVNAERALAAAHRAPALLVQELDKAIDVSLHHMARTAKGYAPKFNSTLTNSIGVERPSRLEGLVTVGAAYGIYVEQGVEPGSYPNVGNIRDWVLSMGLRPLYSDPDADTWDIAWAISRAISYRGLPARPFLEPAFVEHQDDTERRLDAAIDIALEAA